MRAKFEKTLHVSPFHEVESSFRHRFVFAGDDLTIALRRRSVAVGFDFAPLPLASADLAAALRRDDTHLAIERRRAERRRIIAIVVDDDDRRR